MGRGRQDMSIWVGMGMDRSAVAGYGKGAVGNEATFERGQYGNRIKKLLEPCLKVEREQASIKPLVEEFFAWIRETLADQKVLPKGETAKGLNYCLNQEKYLKVFLTDGEVPIDDSASERALRNFTIGRKNWVTINTVRGAQASAIIYSLTETARANNLNVYYYVRHLLTELPQLIYANGKIEKSRLEPLMPWSKTLPADCYSKRRK